jgi:hypothetical protein
MSASRSQILAGQDIEPIDRREYAPTTEYRHMLRPETRKALDAREKRIQMAVEELRQKGLMPRGKE